MKPKVGIEPVVTGGAMVLSVGMNVINGVALNRILHGSGASLLARAEWTLITQATLASTFSMLREISIPIVVCDCDFMPDAWRETLEHISGLPDPPLVIVTSRLADERLWAEALNVGAFDVLVKPFDPTEVIRILSLAWQHWKDRDGVYGGRTKQSMNASVREVLSESTAEA
jgi:DNA-binding response OmpR family regulator